MSDDSTVPSSGPPTVPDHELIRRVGHGSYGEVWLARSVMGTFRAVKIVSRKSFDHPRPFEREFAGIQKFEPVSRSHPGFVAVLHVGRNTRDGYFYYVMEVADDETTGQSIQAESYVPKTLSRVLRGGRLPLAECLRLGLALTEALGCLHRHGLIHRDIKPSNIIFVKGAPKFADIGLVTGIGEGATFVGTEGYLPPEGPGSARADLYSMGKVLYEMSFGQSAEDFPMLPARLPEFDRVTELMQLNEVILRACHQDPSQRFPSAEEMCQELAGLGLGARPPGTQSAAPTSVAVASTAPRVVVLGEPGLEPDTRLWRELEARLAEQGWAVFHNPRAELSLEWARELETAVARARRILLLLSAASLRSPAVAYAAELIHRATQVVEGAPEVKVILIGLSEELPRSLEIAVASATRVRWDPGVGEGPWMAELTGLPGSMESGRGKES